MYVIMQSYVNVFTFQIKMGYTFFNNYIVTVFH